MVGYLEIICGLAAIVALLYYYLRANYDFWKVRGIPGPKPLLFFGNTKSVLLGNESLADYSTELYEKYKSKPMIGIFEQTEPLLVVNDPDIIKTVLIKDFSKFSDRGIPFTEKPEPLTANIFRLETKRWRPLRTRLSPTFTSGKLKHMFGMIVECSNLFEKYIDQVVAKSNVIEVRDLTAKFTTDVIGTCAFGIDTKSLVDEDSEFRRWGKHLFQPGYVSITRLILRDYFPKLYLLLGYVLPYRPFTKFFTDLTMDTIKYRRENKIVRHDFIDTLMELQDQPEKMPGVEMTDYITAAQALVFFAAGFETSSGTISNALYELALNQDIQDKLRQEINEVYANTNGNLEYESVKDMKYLDQVFRETLRLYPPVAILMRRTVADHTFEGTKVTIPKGYRIWIPVHAIQRDPDIYPNPTVFDPERFNEEAFAARHPMYYLPFGDGPRNCVGARFGIFQTKIGIIKIIRNYKVETCDKTPIPYVKDVRAVLLTPVGGIHLKFTKL